MRAASGVAADPYKPMIFVEVPTLATALQPTENQGFGGTASPLPLEAATALRASAKEG
jgi:hypothetical protein